MNGPLLSHPLAQRLVAELGEARSGAGGALFVLLDGARSSGLSVFLDRIQVPHASLYRSAEAAEMQRVAPYLAPLELDGALMARLASDESFLRAALFGVTSSGLDELRRHLRRFLLVLDDEGRERYLRFYDPRVLRPLLEASTPAEQAQFFGPARLLAAYREFSPDKPVLDTWTGPPVSDARAPSALDKFRLRPEHMETFRRDVLSRYEQRCVEYLRSQCPVQLLNTKDDAIRRLIAQARDLGATLGISTGHDISILAETLVLSDASRVRAMLERLPASDRPRGTTVLRDRLRADAFAKLESAQ